MLFVQPSRGDGGEGVVVKTCDECRCDFADEDIVQHGFGTLCYPCDQLLFDEWITGVAREAAVQQQAATAGPREQGVAG